MIQGSPCVYGKQECMPYFKIRTFLSSSLLKNIIFHGDSDYIPINLSKIPEWILRYGIDVALIQVTPPNDEGYCNLGVSVDFIKTAVQYCKLVIAQVNEKLPWTYGDTTIHVTDIDAFVLSNRTVLEIPQRPITEIEKKIGENVAELIPDRATIQIGIGNISESVLKSLKFKKDLGVHSGTFSDGLIDLIENGVITNHYKKINKGKVVSTSVSGTKNLYQYVHKNKLFELYPVNYTHNINVLSQIDRFYSINSALEVDLTGQVNAEKVDFYQVAGVGGQMDFIHGSQASNQGKSIIALPSTAKNNTVSRIAFQLTNVTSLKSEIDYVVTEYGVATLFGKTLTERARELISVAHPNFRKELKESLVKQKFFV